MAKYYNNIDVCPVSVFHNILSAKKDFSILCYQGKANSKKSNECWDELFNEYMNEFGMPTEYIKHLKEMIKVCDLYDKAYNQERKDLLTMAEHRYKIASMQSTEPQPINYNQLTANVSKFMGFQIDTNKTTVRQYYSYIELMKNG